MLDGRTLWLAVEAAPGRLGLRDTATGDVVSPAGDLDRRPARAPLAPPRPGRARRADEAGEASYDVVLVDSGRPGATARCGAPRCRPHGSRPHDGHRWEVRRTDDGLLGLRRTAVAPAVELVAVSADPEGLRLVVEPRRSRWCCRDEDAADDRRGQPTTRAASAATDVPLPDSTLTVAALDGVGDRATRVTTADGRPVVRRDNDLLNPGRGAPLPELYLPGDGVRDPLGLVRVRLRWSDDGVLLARVLGPEASA